MEEAPIDQFLKYLTTASFDPWIFVKILFLIGFFFYLAFAIIVVRQVNLMTKTLNTNLEIPLKIAAWIHLLAALAIFFSALAFL